MTVIHSCNLQNLAQYFYDTILPRLLVCLLHIIVLFLICTAPLIMIPNDKVSLVHDQLLAIALSIMSYQVAS